jgi:cytochrome c2
MEEAAAITHGDPRHGQALIRSYGCDACHTVPGVRGADRAVGPPLGGIVHRMYIAGVLTNTPEHMVKWIRDPREIDPRTAMPDVGVTESDARDIAAYLYSLR